MDSFIGEIRAFPYNFVPQGWAECNGQSLPINQYQPLYSIIGKTYGGDSQTFKIPDFRGAGLVGVGNGDIQSGKVYTVAQRYGVENVTLVNQTLPYHNHDFVGKGGNDASRTNSPNTDNQSYLSNISYQRSTDPKPLAALAYLDASKNPVILHPETITTNTGNNSPVTAHENRSPFLAIRYCICIYDGDYPVRP